MRPKLVYIGYHRNIKEEDITEIIELKTQSTLTKLAVMENG